MSISQELESEKYFKNHFETERPEVMASVPAARRSSTSFIQSAIMFVVVATSVAGAAVWMQQPKGNTKSHAAADFFLWITGSNLTWEQYQRKQRDRGNQRMDETEYDWTQQLFNDAYSNSR